MLCTVLHIILANIKPGLLKIKFIWEPIQFQTKKTSRSILQRVFDKQLPVVVVMLGGGGGGGGGGGEGERNLKILTLAITICVVFCTEHSKP